MLARLNSMEKLIIEVDQPGRDASPGDGGRTCPTSPGWPPRCSTRLPRRASNVDMIVQSVGRQKQAAISFTVPARGLGEGPAGGRGSWPIRSAARRPPVARRWPSWKSRRSACGATPAWPAGLFQSLAAVGINVDMINTSEMRVNVVVDGSCGQKALEVLRAEFADALV